MKRQVPKQNNGKYFLNATCISYNDLLHFPCQQMLSSSYYCVTTVFGTKTKISGHSLYNLFLNFAQSIIGRTGIHKKLFVYFFGELITGAVTAADPQITMT